MGDSRRVMLDSVLDGQDGEDVQMLDQTAAAAEELENLQTKADAEKLEHKRMISVAREQFAEYAAQKRLEAGKLRSQVEGLMDVLDSTDKVLAGAAGDGGGAWASVAAAQEQVKAEVAKLKESLADAEDEAAAYAEQSRADVERYLREAAGADQATPGGEGGAGGGGTAGAGHEAVPADEEGGGEHFEVEPEDRSIDFMERARYIPVRLSLGERKKLRLLEAALSVSEYTDKVDILTYQSKTKRIQTQLKDICAILSGLVVASDYKAGQELVKDRDFAQNDQFFQACFEVGRRHKVMNPEKMRSEYGKLVYLLQDSMMPDIQALLEFQCVRPLRTVYSVLSEGHGLRLLEDDLMVTATAEISAEGKPRAQVNREIKSKERAREALAAKYQRTSTSADGGGLSKEAILQCLYSIGDNNAYLRFNRDPIDKMIAYLTSYFKPDAIEAGHSLAISMGKEGARLSHNHERQYTYALQSLTLWREISNDMFKLWYLAESDLLGEGNTYRLTDTGQGLNRVQQAPQTSREIHAVLARCQRKLGHWVGSGVVHLGDHNVPNALMFIDKYTQVPRILSPLVRVVEEIDVLCKDDGVREFIDREYRGPEEARKTILADFFRHAFDGSGADNFFDAGSCIDGRLTSAWNWCSKIEKKPYFSLFKLSGFQGFDGDYQR